MLFMCGFMGGYHVSFKKYETRDQENAPPPQKNCLLAAILWRLSYKLRLNLLCILFRSD